MIINSTRINKQGEGIKEFNCNVYLFLQFIQRQDDILENLERTRFDRLSGWHLFGERHLPDCSGSCEFQEGGFGGTEPP